MPQMLLTLMTFVPLVGALAILLVPKERANAIRWTALAFSVAALLLSVWVAIAFDYGATGIQMATKVQWIQAIPVYYQLGVDGLSLPLLLLTTALTSLCIVYSWHIEHRVKEYFFMFLLLETGMLGVFVALDFFLFYVFWEISLVPMYFIIGVWGGERRIYASIKFFLYTLFGSVAMLLAIVALYLRTGTFDMIEMAAMRPYAGDPIWLALVFWGLFLGFAIKVPVFPFHTWLPDAHVEAPTAGSVILAGVLLKMGTYGFLRIVLPIVPEAARQFAPVVAVLAVISIVYGALVAMAQWDLKKLIAYSSVSHMGYVMLGIAAATYTSSASLASKVTAVNGAALEMVNHGIITGALFFLVGVIYDRTHTRDLKRFGGLGAVTPVYAFFFSVAMFASLGLPALAGFWSEFLVFVGSFHAIPVHTVASAIGLVLTAAFFLWTIQRVLLGPINSEWKGLKDMDRRELLALTPLLVLIIAIGVYPAPLLNVINGAVTRLLTAMPM
jgi:NADH-quinone oxidoreductase subunit M